MNIHRTEVVSFIAGLAVSITIGSLMNYVDQRNHAEHHDNHPIADPFDSEYHVHADFHIVINDTLVNLDGDPFQTTTSQALHPGAHLHNNNGDVKHIHAEGVTFAGFLDSLGITLTDSCITLDNEYCSGEAEEVMLFVNGELFTSPITQYVPVDNDRILLYYGTYNLEMIQPYLDAIPDDSCYYSGTCPERGIAPDEECGLTCEL
jgi:hypothetical protein